MPRGGDRRAAAKANGKTVGRKQRKPESSAFRSAPRKGLATEILESLGKEIGHPEDCWCERCLWRSDAKQRDAGGQSARRYLWDRADGKPTQIQEDKIIFDPNQPLRVEIEHIGGSAHKAATKAK